MTNKYKDLLEHFGQAPEGQIARPIAQKFAELAKLDTTPSSEEIVEIRNECTYYALVSDFAFAAINIMIKLMVDDESSALQEGKV